MFEKFKALSRLKKLGLVAATLVVLGGISSAAQPDEVSLNVQNAGSKDVLGAQNANQPNKEEMKPVVTTKTVTETESVPYSSTRVNDSSLAKGKTRVTTYGVNGVKTLTYKLTFTDGKQTNKELVSEEVTTQPVTQVTSVGTYVAPKPASNCDPNYSGGCVPIASDVDCGGGNGNGPAYFYGTATVVGYDIYGLDRDDDGLACE